MELDVLSQLGVGGLLAVLVLREVFGFLKNRKRPPEAEPPVWAEALVVRVKEIYMSHDKLESAMLRLAENSARQTAILERLARALGERTV